MQLSELIKAAGAYEVLGACPEAEISALVYDSRRAQPGCLFAALPGVKRDGREYAALAVSQGAVAVMVERPMEDAQVCQVVVPDARWALAQMAAQFYGQPSRDLILVGVTGTNGKTTVAFLLESILSKIGQAGLLGTVEIRWPGHRQPSAMTTPESVDLQHLLAQMRDDGVTGVAMEVSSHALAQRRAEGCLLDAAVFTNLTRDHLDYHEDMRDYFQAKRRLFTELLPGSQRGGKSPVAVICLDDSWGQALARDLEGTGAAVWTYGLESPARVSAHDPQLSLEGGSCLLRWPGGDMRVRTRLVGRFNLQNILGAAATGLALGLDPALVKLGIEALERVPGRLELVSGPAGAPKVFVDYAHTPDALLNVLATLGPLTAGRLITVFGAGGDRDAGKRPLMGRAVGQGCDLAVVTSDNPRTEDPQAIIAAVEQGLVEIDVPRLESLDAGDHGYLLEPDRKAAIEMAIAHAGPQDVVLIAGKGHEDYQVIGHERRHFDDRLVAHQALHHPGETAHA